MSLSLNIKHLRKLSSIRQSDLGNIAGVSDVTIGRYETGERLPSTVEISALSTYFCVSVEMLVNQDLVARFPDKESYTAYKEDFVLQQQSGELALDAVRMAPYRLAAFMEEYAQSLEASTGKPAKDTLRNIESRAEKMAAKGPEALRKK